MMEPENWKNVTDRYFTPEEKARFAETMRQVPEGFEPEEYGRNWRDLGARIEAALPLDPASDQAGDFVEEWFTLLKPFTQVATPEMMCSSSSRRRPRRIPDARTCADGDGLMSTGSAPRGSARLPGFQAALFWVPFGRSETMSWIMPRKL
jgi:hypothetical protein